MKDISIFLFFIDNRPLVTTLSRLQAVCGTTWEEDGEAKSLGNARYVASAMGIRVSFSREEEWSEGIVYRMGGGTDPMLDFDPYHEVDLTFHMQALVEKAGCQRVMLLEEFAAESRRRGLR